MFFINVFNVPRTERVKHGRSQDNYLVNDMNGSLEHSVNTHARHATRPSAIDIGPIWTKGRWTCGN